MDTPERSKIVGTPLSKFEDSPIFNFINNLSPIQPGKSAHGAQVFHSLSFASISSVFSSPHINAQKESRFLVRHPYSDSSKLEISSDNLDENNPCTGISAGGNPTVSRENCNIICSLNEATVDPPEECPTQPGNLSQPIQYDCRSPNHNTTPCHGVKIELKLDNGQTSVEVAHDIHDGVEKRKILFAAEIELLNGHQVTENKEDVAVCDWENLISEDADDLLIFDSSDDSESCKNLEEDNDANLLTCSSKAVDVTDSYPQNATQCPPKGNNEEVIEEHGTDHTPQILSGTFQRQVVSSDSNQETGNGTGGCISVDCKVESQQQRGMRRRCLTFELAGGSTKNSNNGSNLNTSISLPPNRKFTSDKKPISLNPGSSSSRILPSIGLHLNILATTPSDRMVTKETLAFGKRFISMPCFICPFPPLIAGQISLNKLLDVENEQCPTGSEVRDLETAHDDTSEATEFGVCENLCQSSPKKKKRKSENGGESEGCKRCNCKKSKCLKLYCECFAAGIYCVEPCSCQGCFNKPIHEETVLATRKQIESRNPLAFAPKVIQTSEPVQDMGGGVGCSPSCRCEGCKNAFGRKDVDEVEQAEEAIDSSEKQQDKPHEDQQNDIAQKNDHLLENILPMTPSFEICRPFVKPSFLSSGKPPLSSTLPLGYPTAQTLRRYDFPLQHKIVNHLKPPAEDETPEILRGNASPNNGVKTISPNGKRVSPPCGALGISPNRKGGRKLILRSIPSLPSLNGDVADEHLRNYSSSPSSSSQLN